jgi:hypothetical protein
MILRNGKKIEYTNFKKNINQTEVLRDCIKFLPNELLRIISNYNHCKKCFISNHKHCSTCNQCNVNPKTHLTCKKCKTCYPKYITRIFYNLVYYHTINTHIHCEHCDAIKDYSLLNYIYYCPRCPTTYNHQHTSLL